MTQAAPVSPCMNICVLDGFTLNPGDLSWKGLEQYGTCTIHDRVDHSPASVIAAIGDAGLALDQDRDGAAGRGAYSGDIRHPAGGGRA